MLRPCLGEMNKNILFWSKRCPVPLGPLQALLVDSLQRYAVLLCRFAKSQCIHIVNTTGPRGWQNWWVADFDKDRLLYREVHRTEKCTVFKPQIPRRYPPKSCSTISKCPLLRAKRGRSPKQRWKKQWMLLEKKYSQQHMQQKSGTVYQKPQFRVARKGKPNGGEKRMRMNNY